MTPPPVLSPDGRYRWDGRQWVPNENAPLFTPLGGGGQAPTPAAPRRRRRWPFFLAAAVVLLVGVCTVAAANSGGRAPAQANARTARPAQAGAPARDGSCAPQPCANDNYGWIVTVSGFQYDAQGGQFTHPEAGNVYVSLDVTFTNELAREQHADPFRFVLLDGAGIKHPVTWTETCPIWQGVNVTQGATLGPKCLVFEATAGKPSGLALVWTPNPIGGGDYDIKLS